MYFRTEIEPRTTRSGEKMVGFFSPGMKGGRTRYYDIYPPVSGSFHSLARCFSRAFPNRNRATPTRSGGEMLIYFVVRV